MSGAKKGRFRRTWQRMRTVPGLGRDVVAVGVVVLLGLIATGIIVKQQVGRLPWDSGQITVKAEFSDAVAVNPTKSQQVRIAGVPVGLITGAEATGRGTSIISMDIDKGNVVYDNAHARLRPVNPLNEMYVDLDPGGPPAKPLAGGTPIPLSQTDRPTQVDEILSHLDTRTQNALTNLLAESNVAFNGAAKNLPTGLQATDETLKNLQPVVTALQARRDKIQTLVTSLSQISTAVGNNDERLSHLVGSTEQTLGVLSQQQGPLADAVKQLPGVTDDLRAAMEKTSGLTKDLNPLLDNVKSASAKLPGSLKSLSDFADQVKDTVPKVSPVVEKARPLVANFRPVVSDLRGALIDLQPVTQRLDVATGKLVQQLQGVSAFVYNTSSLTAASDVNGTMVRGQLEFNLMRPFGVEPQGCAPLPNYLPCLPGGLR
jgi:phospholipid/cholesterol/gamma-HCH transport system substrate-binding protein